MNITDVLLSHGVGVGKKLKGDALPEDVLSGKTFSNIDGNDNVGTMANRGAVVMTPGLTNTWIPKGYHDGTGYFEGSSDLVSTNIKVGVTLFGVEGDSNIVDTSDADAYTSHILANRTAYVKGALKVGNMPDRGATNITPGTTNKTIATGYHSGGGVVYGDANLIPDNIKIGKSIFGVNGANGMLYATGTVIQTTSSQSFTISDLGFQPTFVFLSIDRGSSAFVISGKGSIGSFTLPSHLRYWKYDINYDNNSNISFTSGGFTFTSINRNPFGDENEITWYAVRYL